MSNKPSASVAVRTESPLNQIDFSPVSIKSHGLTMTERAFLGHVNVRGNSESQAFMAAMQAVLGVALPTHANTLVSTESVTALWIGPDEWWVLIQSDVASFIQQCHDALGDEPSLVTDVSGGFTAIDISGDRARDMMKKATPLDAHPREFALGQCASSVFAHASATFYLVDEAPTYRVLVRRSFADYIGHWLLDAVREFA